MARIPLPDRAEARSAGNLSARPVRAGDTAVVFSLVDHAGRDVDAPGGAGTTAGSENAGGAGGAHARRLAVARVRQQLRRAVARHSGYWRTRRAAANPAPVLLHTRSRGGSAGAAYSAIRSNPRRGSGPPRAAERQLYAPDPAAGKVLSNRRTSEGA